MAPTLVFDHGGRLELVVGAAGGGAIPGYVAQTILGVVSYRMDPLEAINDDHLSGQAITSNCGGVIGARSRSGAADCWVQPIRDATASPSASERGDSLINR